MKAWRAHRFGAPRDVLQLDDVDAPIPAAGELKIRVTSVTLNFNDLDGIHGRYKTVPRPVPYIPGMEVLGVVDECGTGTASWLGRRVVAIPSGAFGGYAEYVVAPASMAFEMPVGMPEPEAAAIFMPFHLAWLALYERARVQPGETLLVHAGAGGAGSAALQLGVHAGARVFATAGSPEKTKLCLDLGAELAINYRETDFAEAVLDATAGRGSRRGIRCSERRRHAEDIPVHGVQRPPHPRRLRFRHRTRRRGTGAATGAVRELLARRRVPRVRRRPRGVQAR